MTFRTLIWVFAASISLLGELLPLHRSEAASLLGASRFFPGLYYPDAQTEQSAGSVTISPGLGFEMADFALTESGGTIVGRVSDASGPLAGVLVRATRGAIVVDGRTDANGRFSLEGVPAGPILLRFATDHPWSRDRVHAAVYLGGVTDPKTSPRVEVVDSEVNDLGEQELALGVVLGGRVRTPDGFGLEAAVVEVVSERGNWSATTGPNGDWRRGGLHPGTYLIRVTPPMGSYLPEYFGGARSEAEAAPVGATEPVERFDLDVDLDLGAEIRGQIRAEGTGEPFEDLIVEGKRRSDGFVYRTRTDQIGNYLLDGLSTGSYLIFVPRLHRYYPSAVREEDARPVSVVEGGSMGRVDVTGFDLGTCQVPPSSRGVISGVIDADFSLTSSILVSAYSESDTIETVLFDRGGYQLDCVPDGSYFVRFLPRGGYPTHYYPQALEIADAVRVAVDGDTAKAVDYLPDRAGWIAGRVTHLADGTDLGDVRVVARSLTGVDVASALTDADGTYRIDSLPDGSGLPAGVYRVRADSTLLSDPDVTPVLQPQLEVSLGLDWIHVSADLDPAWAWQYRLQRRDLAGSDDAVVAVAEGVSRAGHGRVELDDRPLQAGRYRYELEARPTQEPASATVHAVSDPVQFGPGRAASLRAYPDPWNGNGTLRLRRSGNLGPMTTEVIAISGRRLLRLPWAAGDAETSWDGKDTTGRAVPSGVYYVGLRNAAGRMIEVTTVVVDR